MQLFELFDSSLEYKWVTQKPDYWRAIFYVDDIEYSITADMTTDGWYHPDDPSSEVRDCDLSFGLTSDGFSGSKVVGTSKKEFVIFSTVIKAFKEFLTYNKPQYLSINAYKENESRFPLYKKMVQRLSKEIDKLGYKESKCLIYKHTDTTQYFDSICFELKN